MELDGQEVPVIMLLLLLKSMVQGYTRKDGVAVKPHSDNRTKRAKLNDHQLVLFPTPAKKPLPPNPFKGLDPVKSTGDLFEDHHAIAAAHFRDKTGPFNESSGIRTTANQEEVDEWTRKLRIERADPSVSLTSIQNQKHRQEELHAKLLAAGALAQKRLEEWNSANSRGINGKSTSEALQTAHVEMRRIASEIVDGDAYIKAMEKRQSDREKRPKKPSKSFSARLGL
jgi:hypothetical protein